MFSRLQALGTSETLEASWTILNYSTPYGRQILMAGTPDVPSTIIGRIRKRPGDLSCAEYLVVPVSASEAMAPALSKAQLEHAVKGIHPENAK